MAHSKIKKETYRLIVSSCRSDSATVSRQVRAKGSQEKFDLLLQQSSRFEHKEGWKALPQKVSEAENPVEIAVQKEMSSRAGKGQYSQGASGFGESVERGIVEGLL